MTDMGKVALLGATGALGWALGRELSGAGRPYRAVGRTLFPLQLRFKVDPLAEIMTWDTELVKKNQPDSSLEQAVAGADTIVYLVGMPLWKFDQHLALTRQVLAAARAAGSMRLLLVSSSWAYGVPQTTRVAEDHPLAASSVKGRIRREQEEMVLAAHQEGALETAVLRVADFYGPFVEASYLWSPLQAAHKGAHAQLLSPAGTPHDFVYVPDAAGTIVRVLETPGFWGRAWNLGGSEPASLTHMAEMIFSVAGKPPAYDVPPAWKLRVVAMMNPYVRELRELQYLLETPVILDDRRLAGLLGGLKKTPHEAAIRETLGLGG